jgi:hypothetical protein
MIPIRYIDAGPLPQQMSIAAATAPGRAAAQIGQAIEGLGQTGQKIVQQVRAVEDAGKTAEMFAEFNMSAGRFSNELLSREDTGNWAGDWQNELGDYKRQIDESDLSPQAKAAALNRLTTWGSDRAVSFEKQALLKGVELGKTRLGTAVAGYTNNGDFSSARDEIENAPPELLSSADKERSLQNIDQTEFQYNLMRDAEDSPSATLERLEDPDEFLASHPEATIDGVNKAKSKALSVQEERRQEQNEQLDGMQMRGLLTEQEVDRAEYLSDKDKQIRKQALRDNKPPSNEQTVKAWEATDTLRKARQDPSIGNEEYRKIYNEAKMTVLSLMPLNYQGEIRKELGYLSPAGRDPSMPQNEGPITKDDLREVAWGQIKRSLDENQFGDISEDASKDDREKAFRGAEDARLAAKKFIASVDPSDPDATEKVRAYVDSQISGKKNVNAAKALPPPGTGQGLRLAPPKKPLTGRSAIPFGQLPPEEKPFGVLPPKNPEESELDQLLNDGK